MSMALRILPLDCLEFRAGAKGSTTWGYSHNLLEVGGVSEEFYKALVGQALPLPQGHDITGHAARVPSGRLKGEPCYGLLTTDSYGNPYTWTTAGDLFALFQTYVDDELPVYAYVQALAQMDDKRFVILDWH